MFVFDDLQQLVDIISRRFYAEKNQIRVKRQVCALYICVYASTSVVHVNTKLLKLKSFWKPCLIHNIFACHMQPSELYFSLCTWKYFIIYYSHPLPDPQCCIRRIWVIVYTFICLDQKQIFITPKHFPIPGWMTAKFLPIFHKFSSFQLVDGILCFVFLVWRGAEGPSIVCCYHEYFTIHLFWEDIRIIN